MIVGYVRVSTHKQNFATQEQSLKDYGVEKFYYEEASGRKVDRSVLLEVLDFLRPGDTLVIYDLSRLGRTFYQVMKLIDEFSQNDIGLVAIKENLDITTALGRAMVRILASFNQMQVELQNEKIKEGIENAKAKGVVMGRKPITPEKIRMIKALCKQGYTNQEVADQLNISRRSVNKYKKNSITTEVLL
jgi:DNA invertase Pin-like site-specific DNA recombinase